MESKEPRAALAKLMAENGDNYAGLSKLVGKNAAYIQQFIKRGTPKRLGENERAILARYYGVSESMLGAPVDGVRRSGLKLVPKLAIGASAGAGSLTDLEALAGRIGFDEKWLKQLTSDPDHLSLIRVQGDSMAPTLLDGDDIMVDRSAARTSIREGIHVIRMDDALMVKRLGRGPAGRLSVLSDNPAYPDWPDVDGSAVAVIGRVVWTGRRL
jgi:phage repressor protein C with HTH and peptisase S24 domain